MLASYQKSRLAAFSFILLASVLTTYAQSGNSTSVAGTVLDASGAVVTNATIELRNPVSGFLRTAVTDTGGAFLIPNVPFNPYHLTVTGRGFTPSTSLPRACRCIRVSSVRSRPHPTSEPRAGLHPACPGSIP
jgi:hypothetical protein